MHAIRERLFFALLPPPPARAALVHVAAALRAAQVLHGRWLDAAKYHLTLPFLGSYAEVPAATIVAARAAADTVRAAPFALALDRLDAFERRRSAPCVLHAAAACTAALQALHGAIGAALAAHDVVFESARAYVPHLTLAYGELAAPLQLAAPLEWRATEFALLRSRVASGIHETLATWPLRG